MELKKEEELTELTKELLRKTNTIKDNIKKSMIVGEFSMLKGIMIFEVVLKEINPVCINDDEIAKITNYIELYLRKKEEDEKKVNNYLHHGINQCLIMLNLYNKDIKRRSLNK